MLKVQVLGSDGASCGLLFLRVQEAVRASGVHCTVEKVTDAAKVHDLRPPTLPALAINGKIVSAGEILSAADIQPLLVRAQGPKK